MKIGILGNGQLGMMLALAAHSLGHRVRFFAPDVGAPTTDLGEFIQADYTDREALTRFAQGLDVVTYEFENVDPAALEALAGMVPLHPPIAALSTSCDRLNEKRFFRSINAATPDFRAVSSLKELQDAVATIGSPAVLKTRRFGYDGKGQFVIRTAEQCEEAWRSLGAGSSELILEAFVAFERELSQISVRDAAGNIAFYDLVENHHKTGILERSIAPAPQVNPALQQAARQIAQQTLEKLNYVGLLTIELFQVGEQLLVNEMAPRVHNSGHWTIEGAVTSQFENHIRAICGSPLGSTQALGPSTMFNILGTMPAAASVLAVPNAHLHDYGKEPKPGRKIGHITVSPGDETVHASLEAIAKMLAD